MNIRKFFNPDRIVGSSAFIISLGTFLVLAYQTYLSNEQATLNRQEQYASVLPYLELWTKRNKGLYNLALVNNGLGPAFIKSIRVHYQGKAYEGDPAQFLYEVVVPGDSSLYFGFTNVNKGRLIPAGQSLNLIEITNSEQNAEKARKLFLDSAQVEVVYSSVYQESWQITGISKSPKKIK